MWFSVAIAVKLQKSILCIIIKAMLFSKSKNTGNQNLEMAMQSEMSVRFKLIEHGQRQS